MIITMEKEAEESKKDWKFGECYSEGKSNWKVVFGQNSERCRG